jgi:ABC-2 type transport system permease protein
MIFSLIRRDLRGRYKGSALGFMWTFLNPLFQLVVYTFVFSGIMRAPYEKYYLFLFVTLIPWIFFSASVVGGASCVWSQKDMVNKIYFPREVLPVAFVTCQLVNLLLTFIVIFTVLLVTGYGVNGYALLFLPLIIIIEYLLALGITMIVSAVTVFLRDVEYILGIFVMAWQFLSPVMYGIDMVPEEYHKIFSINPMTPIMIAYRDILYYKKIPEMHTLLQAVVLGIALLAVGILVFEKLKRHFSEEM